MRKGFTLIQISIMLTLASMVMVAVLPSMQGTLNNNISTTQKMNTVLAAMRQYQSANAKLPCPADPRLAVSDINYGIQAAKGGVPSNGGNNCVGGTPAAPYADTTNHIALGMVPVHTLGLSNDYALDSYGRYITYAVDTNATNCFVDTLIGNILVTDNTIVRNTVVALVSHGSNGHGAWLPRATTGTSRLNAGSTDTNELLNAHVNASFVAATSNLNKFVRAAPSSTFDDIVVYSNAQWNLNQAPLNAYNIMSYITSVNVPVTATYHMNQPWDFNVVFSQPVAVTGTPILHIDLQEQTGGVQATYFGGTGTNTLDFRYVLPTAPYGSVYGSGQVDPDESFGTSGVISPIDVSNGSTITSGSLKCPTTYLKFTGPAAGMWADEPAGITIDSSGSCSGGTNCIYIADSGNVRIDKWADTAQPNYTTNNGFMTSMDFGQMFIPGGLVVDQAGRYLYLADTGGVNIEKIDTNNIATSGPYYNNGYVPDYFGAWGNAGGYFGAALGIVVDHTGNCLDTLGNHTDCLYITDAAPPFGTLPMQRCSIAISGTPANIATNYPNPGAKTINCAAWGSKVYSGTTVNELSGIAMETTSTTCTPTSPCFYVVDTGNHRILKLNSSGALIASLTSSTLFKDAVSITVETAPNCTGSSGATSCFWITDILNNNIVRCPTDMSNISYCTSVGSMGSSTATNAAPTFYTPISIAYDPNYGGRLLVLDENNSRVVIVSTTAPFNYLWSFGIFGTNNNNTTVSGQLNFTSQWR